MARVAVIREAETWLGTRYHHMGRIKGAGVDCLMFLAEVYAAVGLIESVVDIPYYRPDFMQHRNDETYLEGILKYGHEIESPRMADVVLYKWGRVFSHGGIVVEWPKIIHAAPNHHGVSFAWGNQGRLANHEMKFLSLFSDD